MNVVVEFEAGFEYSLYGIGLSYGKTSNISYKEFLKDSVLKQKMWDVSIKLYNKNGGHNKFLETIDVFCTITAPRYFWQQYDTYRVAITKQSTSTMHTLMKEPITQEMFEGFEFDEPLPDSTIERLENLRINKKFRTLKRELPESFLQTRAGKLSYMNIRNILSQRRTHKLEEWQYICVQIYKQLEHQEYFNDIDLTKLEDIK